MNTIMNRVKDRYDMRISTNPVNIPLILSFAAAIIFLIFSFVLYGAKEKERETRISVQNRLDETLAAKERVELRLRDLEIEAAAVKANLKAKEDELGVMSGRLEEEKALSSEKSAALKEKDTQISRLTSNIGEVRIERDKIAGDLEKLNYEHQQLKFYLDNLMKTKEEIDAKAKEIIKKQGVSLGTIVLNQKQ